jgi:uncharacterized membrane protein
MIIMADLNIGKKIRKYILTGLAVLFPLFITVYIIVFVFRMGNRFAGRYINAFLLEQYGFALPGLGLVFILLLLIVIGFVSSHFIGRRILPFFEKIFMRIPLVANLYPSAKQLSDFLFRMDKKREFKKVVLVPYPVHDSYSMGFITNEGLSVSDKESNEEIVSVLVPLAPAPFSGVLLFLPKKKIKILDIPIDDAIKLIVSGGVVLPSKRKFNLAQLESKE